MNGKIIALLGLPKDTNYQLDYISQLVKLFFEKNRADSKDLVLEAFEAFPDAKKVLDYRFYMDFKLMGQDFDAFQSTVMTVYGDPDELPFYSVTDTDMPYIVQIHPRDVNYIGSGIVAFIFNPSTMQKSENVIFKNKEYILSSLKGGVGSGNFGHAGRPGKVGGSAPSGVISAGVGSYSGSVHTSYPVALSGDIDNFIKQKVSSKGADGALYPIDDETDDSIREALRAVPVTSLPLVKEIIVAKTNSDFEHMLHKASGATQFEPHPSVYGYNDNDVIVMRPQKDGIPSSYLIHEIGHTILNRSKKRNQWYLAHRNPDFDRFTEYSKTDVKEAFSETFMAYVASGGKGFSDPSMKAYNEAFSIIDAVLAPLVSQSTKEFVLSRLKGGAGSGNFGHAGRPGKVGGSAPNNAVNYIGDSRKFEGETNVSNVVLSYPKHPLRPQMEGRFNVLGAFQKTSASIGEDGKIKLEHTDTMRDISEYSEVIGGIDKVIFDATGLHINDMLPDGTNITLIDNKDKWREVMVSLLEYQFLRTEFGEAAPEEQRLSTEEINYILKDNIQKKLENLDLETFLSINATAGFVMAGQPHIRDIYIQVDEMTPRDGSVKLDIPTKTIVSYVPSTIIHELAHKLYFANPIKNREWQIKFMDRNFDRVTKYSHRSPEESFAETFSAYIATGGVAKNKKIDKSFRALEELFFQKPTIKGGVGSGNFGHAGRPGKVGGSAPSGSISMGIISPKDKEVIIYDGYHKAIESLRWKTDPEVIRGTQEYLQREYPNDKKREILVDMYGADLDNGRREKVELSVEDARALIPVLEKEFETKKNKLSSKLNLPDNIFDMLPYSKEQLMQKVDRDDAFYDEFRKSLIEKTESILKNLSKEDLVNDREILSSVMDDYANKYREQIGETGDSRWGAYIADLFVGAHAPLMKLKQESDFAIAKGMCAGEISYAEAKNRYGYYPQGTDRDWHPLPETLYHATTDAYAVLAQGIKSRKELGGFSAEVGLGGGSDDTISFGSDLKVIKNIERSLHEAHFVATGQFDINNMFEIIENGGGGVGKPWTKEFGEIAGTDYETAKNRFIRKHNEATTTDARIANAWEMWHNTYVNARRLAGGFDDPLFFGTNWRGLAKKNPSNFKTMEYKPKSPKAIGWRLSSLSEFRIYGGENVEFQKSHDFYEPNDVKGIIGVDWEGFSL